MNKDVEFINTPKLLVLLNTNTDVMVTVERERGCCEVRIQNTAEQIHPNSGTDWKTSFLALAIFEHAQRMLLQWFSSTVEPAAAERWDGAPDPACDDALVYALDELSFDVAAAQAHHESFQQQVMFE